MHFDLNKHFPGSQIIKVMSAFQKPTAFALLLAIQVISLGIFSGEMCQLFCVILSQLFTEIVGHLKSTFVPVNEKIDFVSFSQVD